MEHGNANLDDNSFKQFSIQKSNPGIRFEAHFPTCTKLWSVDISTALCPRISPPQWACPPMGACAQMFNFSISILLVQFMMWQYSSGLYSEPPPLMRHLPVRYGLLLAVPLPVSGAMQIPQGFHFPKTHPSRDLWKPNYKSTLNETFLFGFTNHRVLHTHQIQEMTVAQQYVLFLSFQALLYQVCISPKTYKFPFCTYDVEVVAPRFRIWLLHILPIPEIGHMAN